MFFSSKGILALDIGSSSIKLAELDVGPRGAKLRKFGIQPIDPGVVQAGDIVDVSAVSGSIESLIGATKCRRKSTVTALWGNSVIIKRIVMPKMPNGVIDPDQLKWEAEQYIPFDINEIGLDYHILESGEGAETMDVLLVAAKNECLFKFFEAVESSKLKCAIVDVASFALANCFDFNYGKTDRPVALLSIGAGITNFIVMDRGEVTFARDVAIGGSLYSSEIAKSMNISFPEAEALKISASLQQEVPADVPGIISGINEQFIDEIKNSFEFYSATSGGNTVSRFFITGGSMFVPGLVEGISKGTGIPFEIFNPFQRVAFDSKVFTSQYIEQIKALCGVSLGLGLRKLGDR